MKTAGQLLREAREKSEKPLGHIARETRIKEKFLLALENADYLVLPNLSVAQGFAANYAQAVGLNPQVVTALLRRDFPSGKASFKIHEAPFPGRRAWTPRTTLFAAVSITILILGFYLARQYMLFAGAPPLKVEKVILGSEAILVTGKTSPAAAVTVGGEPVLVDEAGNFSAEVEKSKLGAVLEIRAVSRAGKATVVKKSVDLNQPLDGK